MAATEDQSKWFLQYSCPILVPEHEALRQSSEDFDTFVSRELSSRHDGTAPQTQMGPSEAARKALSQTSSADTETFTLVSKSTSAEIREGLEAMKVDEKEDAAAHPFMAGLLAHGKEQAEEQEAAAANMENRMRTDNNDLAYRSTADSLLDLFSELEEVISGPRLADLLGSAWAVDPLMTLKIIFNARSIHLGKSSRRSFYRAAGWLYMKHPLTLIANLRWLSRPVIEKKAQKEGDDLVIVEDETDLEDETRWDVKYGVSHGYWKDILNILTLAANKKLSPLAEPREVLQSENPGFSRGKKDKALYRTKKQRAFKKKAKADKKEQKRSSEEGEAKTKTTTKPFIEDIDERRRMKQRKRHEEATRSFNDEPAYRALHLTVARLFADQLHIDLAALHRQDGRTPKEVSLCAKWAPTHNHFHDMHTFVVSSIAEAMYPRDALYETGLTPTDDRETYIRYAREQYRKDVSSLRKHLDIVERHITAGTFGDIKYERLPSIAMRSHTRTFIEKDTDRFEKYLGRLAEGKTRISGATLLPSQMISSVLSMPGTYNRDASTLARMSAVQIVDSKQKELEYKVLDGQWNTLVQRIKDSGTMSSSIAVCDVSGSMTGPRFPDNTTPMDSSIGLSLLVAEVTEFPFGGTFISFSSTPEVHAVNLRQDLATKVQSMKRSSFGFSTDFVAVFEKLILPMALKHDLTQEQMVKRVFVFSDMQFNEASGSGQSGQWEGSYERIKRKYAEAGYEMPELVFWNLAGGRAGYGANGRLKETTAPKPVTSTEQGTCLVSGYSQGMLKVFLDNGSFEEAEEEEEDPGMQENEDGIVEVKAKKSKAKMDPMKVLKKAIGHEAYDMLKVLD